jgi:APA family basic amino acid/polyamine antiporter
MLVMGSMIGSGIFIVSAEIAREVNSPALLIGAWLVTGFLTIVGALSYGELAAMMPRAGGQYVYLRESLGPLWGFLYGWTLFLVIQTGTIAAVGVAFGKFLGVFFPSISSTAWILHLWKVPQINVGPMVLGNMDVGLNTQNLVAILVVVTLSVINIFGVKTGALIQNVFTFAKASALFGLVLAQRQLGLPARDRDRCFRVHSNSSSSRPGRLAFLCRCLEQRHFHRWGGEESEQEPAAIARVGDRGCDCSLHCLQFYFPERSAIGWQCSGRDDS